jgi:hypothetical protein
MALVFGAVFALTADGADDICLDGSCKPMAKVVAVHFNNEGNRSCRIQLRFYVCRGFGRDDFDCSSHS